MKQDRNSLCQCNSGKKFKHCCGSAESHNNKMIEERKKFEEYMKSRANKKPSKLTYALITTALAFGIDPLTLE